ncbi:MAG TPA: alpha/beta hydrolase-fold protein [Thermoanaerobaculia bacterium]|jgi:predicted alpha/beta superfamily hydrolase|nr:alpha/beta hydrolase-fold protein [Thermoanaerobaculia bacterium]
MNTSAWFCACVLLGFAAVVASAPKAAPVWSVSFVIDMRPQIAAKTFDPKKDAVGVRGGIEPLSWMKTTPALDAKGDGVYSVTVTFRKRPFGGQAVPYKYKVERTGHSDDGWEEGRNRLVALDAPAQTGRRVFDEPPPPIMPQRTGTFRAHPAFQSKFLEPRDVIVYLPPDYEKDLTRRYPVLYMHDGQNLFDAVHAGMEWQVDETAERLIRSGAIGPLIVVGVASADSDVRRDEYTPTYVEFKREDGVVLKGGGKADLYGRLLVEELKPFIDRTYRTRPEAAATSLGGSSFGGLVTLYLGLKYPQTFGGTLLAVSPSVWWDDRVILKAVAALPAKTGQRIWVDIGTAEGDDDVADTRRLRDALIAKGWKLGVDLAYVEAKGAAHDEIAWAERMEPMLRFVDGGAKPAPR